jgi:hypothetical protein
LKSENYLPKNIDSEIVAQWYLLWIENKNAWYSFLQGFYPSQAWEIEQILELLRTKATAKDIEGYIKLLRKQEATPVKTSVWNATIPPLSNVRKNMQKTIWFGAWEIDLPKRESEASQTPEMWADYETWFKQKYGANM